MASMVSEDTGTAALTPASLRQEEMDFTKTVILMHTAKTIRRRVEDNIQKDSILIQGM